MHSHAQRGNEGILSLCISIIFSFPRFAGRNAYPPYAFSGTRETAALRTLKRMPSYAFLPAQRAGTRKGSLPSVEKVCRCAGNNKEAGEW